MQKQNNSVLQLINSMFGILQKIPHKAVCMITKIGLVTIKIILIVNFSKIND